MSDKINLNHQKPVANKKKILVDYIIRLEVVAIFCTFLYKDVYMCVITSSIVYCARRKLNKIIIIGWCLMWHRLCLLIKFLEGVYLFRRDGTVATVNNKNNYDLMPHQNDLVVVVVCTGTGGKKIMWIYNVMVWTQFYRVHKIMGTTGVVVALLVTNHPFDVPYFISKMTTIECQHDFRICTEQWQT